VDFPSEMLEDAVRAELEVPEGVITYGDLERVERLAALDTETFTREEVFGCRVDPYLDDMWKGGVPRGDVSDLSLLALRLLRPADGDWSPLSTLDRLHTLFTDEASQELFVEFWRFLTNWYRDIPSRLLSFNLLNESHSADGEELTDETYSTLMSRAIDAIRESSPDRLIFVDMLDVPMGTPVSGLADAQVVQSAHLYFLPDGTQSWPCYFINGFVHRDAGTLSLRENSPAGTKLSFIFDSVHLNSRFTVIAGGKSAASLSLGEEAVGENGCVEIGEAGTEGEWRRYDGAALTVTLSEDCSAVEPRQEGGG